MAAAVTSAMRSPPRVKGVLYVFLKGILVLEETRIVGYLFLILNRSSSENTPTAEIITWLSAGYSFEIRSKSSKNFSFEVLVLTISWFFLKTANFIKVFPTSIIKLIRLELVGKNTI